MTHPYTRFFILPSAPTADEDETEGYEIGDVVYVGDDIYDCSNASVGAAVWTQRSGGSGTPGGSDTQLQFNDSGAFGGVRLDYSEIPGTVTLTTELDGDNGEELTLQGADSINDGNAGDVNLVGGAAPGDGDAGGFTMNGGNASGTGSGGEAILRGGNSTGGVGGRVLIGAGQGVSDPGKLLLRNPATGTVVEVDLSLLTSTDRAMTVPDKSGTIAFLDDVVGGSAHVIQEEGTPLTARANLNFVGGGVTATDDAGNDATVVTIPPNLTTEEVEDIVGAMVSGNTETGISVIYDDAGAKLNFDAQTAGDARYAPIAKGVTNGDSHDHNGGDGAQIDHANLSTIGTNTHAQIDTYIATTAPATFAPIAKGVTNGDTHDHAGGDGNQIDHGGLAGLGDDDHTQYILHSLATAANDFLVASGSGAFVKKTLAQTVAIIQTLTDAIYAPIAKGVTNGDTHNHVGGDGAALSYSYPISTYLNLTVPGSSTRQTAPTKPTLDTTSNNVPSLDAGTLSNLTVRTSSTQPASGTGALTVQLYINNVASSMIVTIANGSGSGTYADNTHTEVIAAGDTLRWECINAASGASATIVNISMRITKSTT